MVCPSSSSVEEGQDQLRKAEVVGHHLRGPHCSPSHPPTTWAARWGREEQRASSSHAMLIWPFPPRPPDPATSEIGLLPSSDQLGTGSSGQFATRWHQINHPCGDTLGGSGPPPTPNQSVSPIAPFLRPPPRPGAAGAARGATRPVRAQGYLHRVLFYLFLAASDKAPSLCVFVCCRKIK